MIVRRLTDDFDMSFGHGLSDFARDAEAIAQNVRTRLQLLRGEWFLDIDAGVPWLQEIMVKPSNLALAESLIKQTIAETDGITEITNFDLTYDNNIRELSINCTVLNEFNNTQNIKVTM